MTTYRILENQYFSDLDVGWKPYYTIEEKKKFLFFITYWEPLSPTFTSLEKAKTYLDKYEATKKGIKIHRYP